MIEMNPAHFRDDRKPSMFGRDPLPEALALGAVRPIARADE